MQVILHGAAESDLPARASRETEEQDASPEVRGGLDDAQLDAVVRAVLERLSDRVVREIAWDVVPDLAETIIRERLRQIERDES